MRLLLLIFITPLAISPINAQKEDYIWLLGYAGGNQSPLNDKYGITELDFSNNLFPKVSDKQEYIVDFSHFNTIISDKDGQPLLYSNGENIYSGKTNSVIFNGGNLIVGGDGWGSNTIQGGIMLPFPENEGKYVLISSQKSYFGAGAGWIVNSEIFSSIIEISSSGEKVIEKKRRLIKDTLSWGKITATKHANGRDWWILVPKNWDNKYFLALLDPNGVKMVDTLQIGDAILDGVGQAFFSPDGTKYIRGDDVWINQPARLDIFDFDRCSGSLSNHQTKSIPKPTFGTNLSISPDSRYLYLSLIQSIHQYDLNASNIFDTEKIVAHYDTLFTHDNKAYFFTSQLGPDGRIYIASKNNSLYMHYINFPNRPGKDCKLVQHGLRLATYNPSSIPNHPNYRLGPLDGSPCDTLGLDNHPVANFRWELEDSLRPLQVTFTDLSYYEPQSWAWDFGDGSTGSTERYPLHEYSKKGNYRVCLTVKNQNSSNTVCRWVNLGVTGVEDADNEGVVRVWPNPVRDVAWLDLAPGQAPARLRLHDVTGRVLSDQPLAEGLNRLDMSGLAAGVYYYEVVFGFGSESRTSGKVVKVE